MKFDFFDILTDRQAKQMARDEEKARPKSGLCLEEGAVKYRPGIYRYKTKRIKH